jgi:7-keto-8-aminopelargonate synthetase-like enzyme
VTAPHEAASGAEVHVGGRRLVSFAGCDSLGLARNPEVVAAAREALERCGVSAGASRTTTGTWDEHARLEQALAEYMDAADAVVLPSGWLACQSLVRALAPGRRGMLVDAGAHPAVTDAAALSGLPVTSYARHDAADAGRLAADLVGGRPLIATCTVDLAQGTLAPLAALTAVAEGVAGALVVDDAHGVGVLGEHGRGTAEHLDAEADGVHVAGTLSKAFGAQGGFVTGSTSLCDAVRDGAPAYGGATPLPPAIAAAATKAVKLAADGALRAALRERCRHARERFAELGLPVPDEVVPWMAVHDSSEERLRDRATALRDAGMLVPYVRYHGAPPQGYLRVAISAAHTADHIDALGDALAATSPSSA